MITPEETLTKALSAAREWLTVQTTTASPPRNAVHPSYQTVSNCITVNTDASWHSDRLVAGLGWIMDTGQNRASHMAHCYFVSSPLVAEALAIREAITLCIKKGFLRVHVKSDSLQLVKAITSGSSFPEVYGVIADICNISLAFDCISFSWIRRENNKDADALARQALLNEPFVVATLNVED
ncbi:uncharacterized protein LOC108825364 [Raphanus sativus]|uniref:Uncharacterized protein LOC108825364 n=1 Tax=Raphanus sativus TaxID=3726 RepID=A0A6J0L2R3_RAPSA|nr:uncharacterized protein LOC108825364 [Raphanus sativus]